MYAIVATSGRQFRVTEGDRILVDRVPARIGETVRLESVLLVGGDSVPLVGRPFVSGAAVEATVLGHRGGEKLIVFRYRPKKRVRRKRGHRQMLSELRIGAIRRPGEDGAGEQRPAEAAGAAGVKKAPARQKPKGGADGS